MFKFGVKINNQLEFSLLSKLQKKVTFNVLKNNGVIQNSKSY